MKESYYTYASISMCLLILIFLVFMKGKYELFSDAFFKPLKSSAGYVNLHEKFNLINSRFSRTFSYILTPDFFIRRMFNFDLKSVNIKNPRNSGYSVFIYAVNPNKVNASLLANEYTYLSRKDKLTLCDSRPEFELLLSVKPGQHVKYNIDLPVKKILLETVKI